MEEQSSSEKKCNSVSSGDNFTMAKPSIGVASSSSNSLSLHKQGLENQKPREIDNKLTPLCVEIFAGKASFSRALVQAGFEVLSIDHEVEGPLRPIVSLDLTTKSGQELLWMILKSPRLVAIHLGLPCGTASKVGTDQFRRSFSSWVYHHQPLFDRQHILWVSQEFQE